MFTARETTFIARIAYTAVKLGVPVYACLPPGIVIERRP